MYVYIYIYIYTRYTISGTDPGGVDGVASHPPFQMKK